MQFKERVDNLTHNRHMAQNEDRHKAYKEIKLLFRKALMASLSDRVMWCSVMQVDPIYKNIVNMAKTLIEMEDYGRYAISKCK